MWILKTGVDKGKNLTPLHYFVRDLVRFHRHESADIEPTTIASAGQESIECLNEKVTLAERVEDDQTELPLESNSDVEMRDESHRPPSDANTAITAKKTLTNSVAIPNERS